MVYFKVFSKNRNKKSNQKNGAVIFAHSKLDGGLRGAEGQMCGTYVFQVSILLLELFLWDFKYKPKHIGGIYIKIYKKIKKTSRQVSVG